MIWTFPESCFFICIIGSAVYINPKIPFPELFINYIFIYKTSYFIRSIKKTRVIYLKIRQLLLPENPPFQLIIFMNTFSIIFIQYGTISMISFKNSPGQFEGFIYDFFVLILYSRKLKQLHAITSLFQYHAQKISKITLDSIIHQKIK